MGYHETQDQIQALRAGIARTREQLRALQKSAPAEPVSDYTLTRSSGEKVKLSELFGRHANLIVIHNMGAGCRYCTLWADGFNGVCEHLASRAAFVVCSPDAPDKQAQFAASRGWKFPLLSHQGTSFATDMGYGRDGKWHPGASVFERRDGQLLRVSDTPLGPGDDFCSVWHFFDLLPSGPAGWEPQYKY